MTLPAPVTPENFDPGRFPRKLNLGCGFDHRPGFLNIDMNAWHKPDVLADVRKVEFLPAQYYDEILAQDVLEHLPRTQTEGVLAHWNRPLRIGGRILIRVPSVLGVADLLRQRQHQNPAKHEELIQCLFGTQAYTGDFHFTSFTEVLLRHYLERAGFRVVTIDTLHGWLFDVVAEKIRHVEGGAVRDFSELLEARDDEEFLLRCYREILEREPDAEGLEFFRSGLRSGGMTRQVAIDVMIGSPEYAKLRAGKG